MNEKVFQSSHLQRGVYDPATGNLEIEFVNGQRYTYEGVPQEKWEALTRAVSPGKFLHNWIKGSHNSRPMGTSET